ACYLLEKLAGAKINEAIIDIGKKDYEKKEICLSAVNVNQSLGVELSEGRICGILNRLNLKAAVEKDKTIRVDIPAFRKDLIRPIDLIEEVGRIYGYQNIPVVIPNIRFSPFLQKAARTVELKVRQFLISAGLNEVINYSLTSREALKNTKIEKEKVISIKNPLNREQEIMRLSLLTGMLNTITRNKDRGIEDIRIFELSRVYLPQGVKKLPVEQMNLSIALTGGKLPNWKLKQGAFNFYDLKGPLEECLARLGIADYEIINQQHSCLDLASSACLKIKGDNIGYLGGINKELLANFNLEGPVYIFECNFDKLVSYSLPQKRFKPFIKYPSVIYDIAVVVKEAVSCAEVVALIKTTGRSLINKINLFDVYRGKQVPEGCKSLAYSIEYQASDRTLTAKEVDGVHSNVRRVLQDKLGARIR
ncbi:MAG: phenylalanine--tRNA ligase subunit beta, partial [Candidatus Omnitrophota bacterium]|nr:phenylalanine--tRNA ligase subunit beta [Candidatus Omnitrophota bacterium]